MIKHVLYKIIVIKFNFKYLFYANKHRKRERMKNKK